MILYKIVLYSRRLSFQKKREDPLDTKDRKKGNEEGCCMKR